MQNKKVTLDSCKIDLVNRYYLGLDKSPNVDFFPGN